MRVLLIHDFYQNFGGEDSIALREKGLLEGNGEEVFFYSRDNSEIEGYGLPQKLAFLPRTLFSEKTYRTVRETVDSFHPHVAYVHNIFPLISPSVFYALKSKSIPSVQNVQDFRWFCPNGLFFINQRVCEKCRTGAYWNAIRFRCFRDSRVLSTLYATAIATNRAAGVLNKIDAILCTTEFNKAKFVEGGVDESRLHIKPNYVDFEHIEPSYEQGNYVVFLGRLAPEKGMWTLIRAFEKMPEIPLKIVGSGPMEDTLRGYVKEKGLRHISLEGFKEGAAKMELLRNSLFMVFSSEWYEHFPIVILEAFAAGKPVVTSKLGNMQFIVEDGKGGLHFEAGNAGDLAQKTRMLVSRPSDIRRMGEHVRTLVETAYSPSANYGILKSIFNRVVH
jgi:glycosyltransferase involved in cell wall biosynthesis